jgi:hypothetical protein
MTDFPQLTAFGNLELIEVYEHYDKPLFISCRNATGHIYFALQIGEDRQAEFWLFLPVSERRFQHVRSGAFDLKTAFRGAEDDFVFQVGMPLDSRQEPTVNRIQASQLTDDMLPLQGERLNLATRTLPILHEPLLYKSRQAMREFLKLGLTFPEVNRTEAPAGVLGTILESLQKTADSLGQSLLGAATKRGAVSSGVRRRTELSVVAVGAGSFEIELASTYPVDLFGDSAAREVLQELMDLLEVGDDEVQLGQQLQDLQIRAAASYARFLNAIASGDASARFTWASPSSDLPRQAEITARSARSVIGIIERTEFDPPELVKISGTLIGANLDKKNYEIWGRGSEGDLTKYSGRVADEAMPSLSGARLENTYLATIRQTKRINYVTGEAELKHELTNLEELA